MVAEIPLIDLDRPPPAPADEAVVRSRPALLLTMLITVLLALAGSVPSRPGLTRVLAVDEPLTAAELAAGSLFLATPAEVRRYALPAGAREWSRRFDDQVQNLWIDPAGGILLVLSGGGEQLLTALDAATGRLLWAMNSVDTVMITLSRGGVLTQEGMNGEGSLRMLDARTGRTRWTRDVDPAGFLGPDALFQGGGSPWIVAVGPIGDVVLFSYADGHEIARGRLELGSAPPADRSLPSNSASVSVVGDRLYVSRRIRGTASLTAYSMRPLAPLWQSVGGPIGSVSDCGPVLCVADTRWVSGVDPASGRVRWQQPSWGIAYRFDGKRLFAYDNQEDAQAALIDAGTGRELRPLGHSRQLGRLILRTDGFRTWVSVPDGSTGDLRVAGSVADVAAFRCQTGGDYLLCPTVRGDMAVWQVH
ncbi:PQQ-like beta-propeller repeat protein [Actinoplanes sp. KI2]|uniref:PQQ-like beta-propeller repeat protein n=1 Tax=Actinoplanes sp. KI2 TaxID=2983315 RepID=UPI0021D5E41B|nr:PQQ-like beta-propeller repeat protein [Actinoplanes sp. KI2]MCU7725271.1 PQQ-like beta-propeller repeat protein [Actinoplanes sp. KI2]